MTRRDFLYLGVIIALALLFVFSVRSCVNVKKQASTNIKAYSDTITYIKSKNNDLIATKAMYEASMRDLKSLNNELYEDIKNMKISDPETIIKYVGKIDNNTSDTSYIVRVDTVQRGFTKPFNFENKWRLLNGTVDYVPDSLKLSITQDIVMFDYTVVVDDDNKLYIKSSNPYVKYESMTGITMPKQKTKKFGIGPQVGYGYNFIDNRLSPYIGIGLHYNLISF